jgi:adenylate kinase
MLRAHVKEGTELGLKAKSYMDQGLLTPDELVIDMFLGRLGELKPDQGFVLDGFPRTLPQAIALDEALSKRGKAIDLAINITAADEVLMDRMLLRAQESSRSDDTPEAIKVRLEKQKPPAELLEHYRDAGKLKDIDGLPEIPFVTMAIMKALGVDAGKAVS